MVTCNDCSKRATCAYFADGMEGCLGFAPGSERAYRLYPVPCLCGCEHPEITGMGNYAIEPPATEWEISCPECGRSLHGGDRESLVLRWAQGER